MRLNSYLSRSRHGIFYFRWPMPNRTIPEKRTSFRLSLRTRCPKLAWEKRRLSLDAYDYSEPSSNALPTDEPTGTAADTFTLQQAIDEYVYEVAVPRSLVPAETLSRAEQRETTALPLWDPMGSVAR